MNPVGPVRTVGELCQRLQAAHQLLLVARENGHGVGCERPAVDGSDEDGVWARIGMRYPAEGAGTERRPQARRQQRGSHAFAARGAGREARLACGADLDHQRLEAPLDVPVYRRHATRSGCRPAHPRQLLVVEEGSAEPNAIAFLDQQGRPQSHGVVAENRDPADCRAGLDRLCGPTRDGQVETPANREPHTHAPTRVGTVRIGTPGSDQSSRGL